MSGGVVAAFALFDEPPTAQTSLLETTDTAYSSSFAAHGEPTVCHELPSQCSTSGWLPVLSPEAPTAHASLDVAAATPTSAVPPLGDGLGVRVQEAPSQ